MPARRINTPLLGEVMNILDIVSGRKARNRSQVTTKNVAGPRNRRYLRCLRRLYRGGFCFSLPVRRDRLLRPTRKHRSLRKQIVQRLSLRKEVEIFLAGDKAQGRA